MLLYITAASREEAISISRELLSERLVACTNIFEHVTSMYHWQGDIEHNPEAVIIAKTMKPHLDRAIARVKELHSYSAPCILALPVTGGSADYIAWMAGEVGQKEGSVSGAP